MARALKPATGAQLRCTRMALDCLKEARRYLAAADAPRSLARVKAAINSTEGAVRHAERRASQPET